MAEFIYIIFNTAVLLPVIILSLIYDVKLHTKWRQFVWIFATVSIPFILWDVWAANNGHWLFSDIYILKYRIFGLPIEEILFFLTVPIAMVYVWLVIIKYIPNKKTNKYIARLAVGTIGLASLIFAVDNWQLGYTRSAGVVSFIVSLALMFNKIIYTSRFWIFQVIHAVLFLMFNTFLTALPVISYGVNSITGFRVGSIPIEDFLFSYILVSASIMVFTHKPKAQVPQSA